MLEINGFGHPNITAKHKTTIAFTRDNNITFRGDCFIAVACSWIASSEFLAKLSTAKKIVAVIECCGERETITGLTHSGLRLSEKDLVIRKSSWVSSNTLMVKADKSANDLNKRLIQCLKSAAPVKIKITI